MRPSRGQKRHPPGRGGDQLNEVLLMSERQISEISERLRQRNVKMVSDCLKFNHLIEILGTVLPSQ